jgi:5-methylthioadenosine/S-adenosylhomocysteine deaminase
VEKNWRVLSQKETSLLSLTLAPHSIYTLSLEDLLWAKEFSQKNKLLLHLHCSETKKEVRDCLRKNKMRPIEYLDKIGLLTSQTFLVHTIWLSEKEIKILKKRKCQIVYSPCSNMKLGSGIFPYRQLKKAGLNICLGTDGSASNNNLNLWSEMKFASLLPRAQAQDSTILPAQETFFLGTKNAAQALNLNAGELKIGKLADFILIDLNHLNFVPNHNLLSNLIYAQSSSGLISDVFCNGRALMRNYQIKDEEKIITESRRRIKKLFSIQRS